jgi:hypothetical protein
VGSPLAPGRPSTLHDLRLPCSVQQGPQSTGRAVKDFVCDGINQVKPRPIKPFGLAAGQGMAAGQDRTGYQGRAGQGSSMGRRQDPPCRRPHFHDDALFIRLGRGISLVPSTFRRPCHGHTSQEAPNTPAGWPIWRRSPCPFSDVGGELFCAPIGSPLATFQRLAS